MTIKQIIVGTVLFALGVTAGVAFGRSRVAGSAASASHTEVPNVVTPDGDSAKFINPAVVENLGKHYIINFLPLKERIATIQAKYKGSTRVYFDYLNNASWVGLGEKDMFTAASTVKVPLAMAIYRLSEQGRLDMSTNYALTDIDLDENFGDLYKAGSDKAFTISELVEIMLKYSDNTAANALYKVLKMNGIDDPFREVYAFMGWIDFPTFGPADLQSYTNINLKTLSNMFITLYNAQYVNVEHSNHILSLLDESAFDDQITAGVPSDIPVAHKIGVFEPNNTYTDCGIVYASRRNYLLCESATGLNSKTASQFMAEVSKATYEYVIAN